LIYLWYYWLSSATAVLIGTLVWHQKNKQKNKELVDLAGWEPGPGMRSHNMDMHGGVCRYLELDKGHQQQQHIADVVP
jgi:hypothetical protein